MEELKLRQKIEEWIEHQLDSILSQLGDARNWGWIEFELRALRRNLTALVSNDLLECQIEVLEFSVRAYNCLRKGAWDEPKGIDTLAELLQHTEKDLLKIHGLRKVTLAEIKDRLRELGLELAKEPVIDPEE